MNWIVSPQLTGALVTASVLLTLSMFLALWRLARGPSLADRVVALDLLALIVVGIVATYDVATEQPVLLDVATALALIAFLGTVAFAHYLNRRGRNA